MMINTTKYLTVYRILYSSLGFDFGLCVTYLAIIILHNFFIIIY